MSSVIEWLADSLFAGSIVMLIVMFIRGVILRRMPRRYAYLLWAVVAVRLICPVSIRSPLSVFSYVPEVKIVQEHSLQGKNTNQISMDSNSTAVSDKHQNQETEQAVPFSEAYRIDSSEMQNSDVTERADNSVSSYGNTGTQEQIKTKEAEQHISVEENSANAPSVTQETANDGVGTSPLLFILFLIWIIGVGVFLLKSVIDCVKLHKRLRTAVKLEKGVYESDQIDTPFVKGIIRPRIYIPFRLTEQERACILTHEKHHIRRGDPIFKLFATALLAMFWFHPLVWVSYRLMVRDMEMSCDEYVLTHETNDIRASYSTLLLAFATNRRIIDGVLFFGENDTKQRVKHIMRFRKRHVALGIIAIFVIAISTCTLVTAAGTRIRNPYTQEYKPGQGNIKGNVDVEKYMSIDSRFEIGAAADGYAVFKDPDNAYDALVEKYAEGIWLIQKEFNLLPLTRTNYDSYGVYGWQTTTGTEEQQEQAAFVSSFIDIYENSFE